MNRGPVHDGARADETAIQRPLLAIVRHRAIVSPDGKPVSLLEENERVLCLAQPCRTFGNGGEHRTDVGRRGGNHPQDRTRGSLLLER